MESEDEVKIERVEIHPEAYTTNLFGEETRAGDSERSDLKNDFQGLTLDKQAFNIFSLTDAIGARKKREAWVLYQKALMSGLAAEEVFYKLFWQMKTMMLAQKTKSVAETDMKPFPYNKAKGFLKNFKQGEIEKLSESLVLGYHKARRGEGEIETLVEKTLLKL